MEIATLVLEYIKVLIWPIFSFTVLMLFREEIRERMKSLQKADLPGGVVLDFQEEVKEAQNLSQQVKEQTEDAALTDDKKSPPALPMTEANARMIDLGLQPSPSGLDIKYYRNLAERDPNLALAGLRIELEILLRNLAKGFNITAASNISIAGLLQTLKYANAITKEQHQLIQQVLRICNAAIHGQVVSREQADDVLDATKILRDYYLRWLTWGFKDGWQPSNSL